MLELEQSAVRKVSEAVFGHWTPRPGMGTTFPEGSWIIQHKNEDVGCFTLHEKYGVVEIEQFYVRLDVRGRGIGKCVMRKIIALTSAANQSIRVKLIAGTSARKFFEDLGFSVTDESATRVRLEYFFPTESSAWIN